MGKDYDILNSGDTMEIEKINSAKEYIRSFTDFVPDVCIVLGSGLGSLADDTQVVAEFSYADVPGLCPSTTPFHAGKLVLGYLGGEKVALCVGRVHIYEGYTPSDAVRLVRVCCALGAKTLLLTNAAGGINPSYKVGDVVAISDHVSIFVESPIKGEIRKVFGSKLDFPDMSEVYDKKLTSVLKECGAEFGVEIKDGVYVQLSGAQYETPAEIRFLKTIGADLVGMSTVIEGMAGVHAGMRVVGLSMVTNMAAGLGDKTLSHEDVGKVGLLCAEKIRKVIVKAIGRLAKD